MSIVAQCDLCGHLSIDYYKIQLYLAMVPHQDVNEPQIVCLECANISRKLRFA